MLHWTELALKKAGYETREAFQKAMGLHGSVGWDYPTCRALWSWMPGFVYHRAAAGETLYGLAQRYSSTVQSIRMANRGLRDRELLSGQLLQVPLPCPVVTCDMPFGSQMQEIFLEGLQARFSMLEASPLTKTCGGRTVWMLRLGTGKRKVLLTAGHHANEYLTSLLLLRLLEEYLNAIGNNGGVFGFSARQLLERTSLYMVPMVNPDGVDLVTGELAPESREYQNAARLAAEGPRVRFPAGWKANLQGVDLNLNYPTGWERAKQIKAQAGVCRPGPRDYAGAHPLDQPETKALYELACRLKPHVMAAWHTQGKEIYGARPDGTFPDEALARRMAKASGYRLAQVPPESANGGFRDWFLEEFDRPAFTIEAGLGENPLPLSQLETIYQDNLPIFALLLAG